MTERKQKQPAAGNAAGFVSAAKEGILKMLAFYGVQWYHTIVVLRCINTTGGMPE